MSHPPPLAIPGRFGIPNASGQKFNKACDPCHISKTRCIPDPLSPTNSCKRCSKNGSACVFSPIGPRRRPVRSKNERIVELEKRVRDMQLRLEKQVEKQVERRTAANVAGSHADREAPAGAESSAEGSGSHYHHHNQYTPPPNPAPPVFPLVPGPGSSAPLPAAAPTQAAAQLGSTKPGTDPEARKAAADAPSCENPMAVCPPAASDAVADARAPPKRSHCSPDVVDRGLITLQQADKLMYKFRQYIHGKLLGIGVPDGYTNQSLRREKPVLWLSMLCAASTGSSEFLPLTPTLSGEMESLLDAHVQEELDPDLEILQALVIFYLHYHDLAQPSHDRLYRCHKVSLAIVTRLGQASTIHSATEELPIAEEDVTERDRDLSRQLLTWHWTSFQLAMKARENLLVRPVNLISRSMRILEASGSQCDLALVQWARLVQIALEAALSLFSGHTMNAEGLTDEDRDDIIQSFERRRRQWLVNCPFDLVNEYHHSALLLSEAIYPAGRANFRHRSHGLPSLSSPSQSPDSTGTGTAAETALMPDQEVLAPYRIQYTKKCITAAHACLSLVVPAPATSPGECSTSSLSDPETLRYCSNVPYSRVFYALRFLLFVAHNVWRTGNYHLINVDSLRAGYYIEGLKKVLRVASDGGKFRTPSMWLYAIETRIEPWWKTFCAMLDRDRPPPSRSKSTGELEGTPVPPNPADAAGHWAAQPPPPPPHRRQTSEPLPHQSSDRGAGGGGGGGGAISPLTEAEAAAAAAQPPHITVPYDLFSPTQAMDFLNPFSFIQQAPPVADAGVVPEHPNIGPQPFAARPPSSPTSTRRRSSGGGGGGKMKQQAPGSQTTSAAPLSRPSTSSGGGDGGAAPAANPAVAHYDLEAAYNQGPGIGELSDILAPMDPDTFDFDWGNYNALFPGDKAFLPGGAAPGPGSVLPSWYLHPGEGTGDGPGEEDEDEDEDEEDEEEEEEEAGN
ncbi:hypothetical protein diail_10920 [Diaporthe ilicicola]|nr:hypothetical protein diail_10920 [Diaporthe ilicicola]